MIKHINQISIKNIFKLLLTTILIVVVIFVSFFMFVNSCQNKFLNPEDLPWCIYTPSCEKICDYWTEICPTSCWHYENKVIDELQDKILSLIN